VGSVEKQSQWTSNPRIGLNTGISPAMSENRAATDQPPARAIPSARHRFDPQATIAASYINSGI